MKKLRKSRAKNIRPKGSYPLPTGGYVSESVHVGLGGKRIRVRGIRRDQPDVRKLMYALIEIAQEQSDQDDPSRSRDDLEERTHVWRILRRL